MEDTNLGPAKIEHKKPELSKEVQERSNRIAEEVLNIWKNNRDAKV